MTQAQINAKLEPLYKAMYDLTNPACHTCRAKLSCCSGEYCEMAKEYAKEYYDRDLIPHNTGSIPFLTGDFGCVVPPHLRPLCTLHQCDIQSFGFKKGDPAWTKKYFQLREQIDILEMKR